ncbi:MAG: hypothetical protein HPY45_04765 [Anaerolineae bacterium]|nr:hypothetical protein [Anaerolineae bacterium]
MQTVPQRAARRRKPQDYLLLEQGMISLLLGVILSFVMTSAVYAGFELLYLGRVYPGISVQGVKVGGLTTMQAAQELATLVSYPQQGQILIYYEGQNWAFKPQEIGLFYDPAATARSAYQTARQGNWLQRLGDKAGTLLYGKSIAPVLIFDQRLASQMLERLAQTIDRPVINAAILLDGTNVSVQNSQSGRKLDIPATLALLQQQMITLQNGAVPLVIREEQPKVVDVSRQAEMVRAILSQPLTLTLPEGQPDQNTLGPWVLEPSSVAAMLSFETVQTSSGFEYRVGVRSDALGSYLNSLAYSLEKSPSNTRFVFNDDTRQLEVIQPAVIGRTLNIGKSIETIEQRLLEGHHVIPLEFIFTPPAVTDDQSGEQLGIRELIHTETSYFYGSSATRVQNIITAASKFHGLLVAPGETFSMAQAMGEVTLDNGYAEALIIYGGQTVKGVGGGVCQVSTTLFRAAFFSGFPIVERYPHAYRVYYYEKTAGNTINERLAGLDATVFVPVVDFRFTNDTPYWLLMETYVSPTYNTLTWKFYSTRDGRTVSWETTGPTNIVPAPKPEYRENPDLPQGEVKQVDWAADGAEVTVKRTVMRDGVILHQDTIYTKYAPWKAIYEYGPGTEGMPPPDSQNAE